MLENNTVNEENQANTRKEKAKIKKKKRSHLRAQKQTGQWDFVLSDCLARDYCIAIKFCICCYPCSMNQMRSEIKGKHVSACSLGCINFLVPCICPQACHTMTLFRNKNNIPGSQLGDCFKTILCPHLSAIQIANQMDLNAATRNRPQPKEERMV
jgi:hypothetical protein